MKNVLFLLMVAVLAFTGCKKDDDNNDDSLNGTTWEYSDEYGEERILSFASSTWVMDYSYAGDIDRWTGSYTYNPPTVTLKIGGDKMKLYINGNTMTSEADEYGDVFVYTKIE